jgi:hypothetical protein
MKRAPPENRPNAGKKSSGRPMTIHLPACSCVLQLSAAAEILHDDAGASLHSQERPPQDIQMGKRYEKVIGRKSVQKEFPSTAYNGFDISQESPPIDKVRTIQRVP